MSEAYDHVPAEELDRAPLRTAISPLPTALTLTRDALQGGRRMRTPAPWRRAVMSYLRRRDAAALAPLTADGTTGWPSLLDEVGAPRETLGEALERIRARSGATLLQALETDRDVTPGRAWDPVRRNPDRWLAAYVDAIHRGWRGLEPLWQRSFALLEREAERVEAAVDRGVPVAQIVSELQPRTSLVDDAWRIGRSPEPRRLGVSDDGVTVAPIVAGRNAGMLASPGDHCLRLAYPLPEFWRAFEGQTPPPASLEALLGRQRTALLERLDDGRPAGQLAEALHLTPSAITFHVHTLEAAGLVRRQRRGRHVIVSRTARGTSLLALYAMP